MGWIVKTGGLLALMTIALGVMSGTGFKMGWWNIPTAFLVLRWALYVGGATAVLGLAGLILTKQRGFSAIVFAVGAGIGLLILMQALIAGKVPMIHDISTDTENPPQFVKVLERRGEGTNSLDYASIMAPVARGSSEMKSNRELQEGFYTDIKPLFIKLATSPCHVVAVKVAFKQGWEVINADAEALIIEAIDTTFWFGFKDDVIIRITETEDGTCRVDMRSASRVGVSDVGVNADRIMTYMAALAKAPKIS